MGRTGVKLSGGVLLIALSTGCVVTRSEGDRIQADLDSLKSEVATLQRQRSDSNTQLSQLATRVGQLEHMTFSKAGAGDSQTNALAQEIQQLRDQLEQTQHQLQQQQMPTPPVKQVDQTAPKDKKALFDWAKQAFDQKDYSTAYERFDTFLEKHKEDVELAPDAYLLSGDAEYLQAKAAAGNKSLASDLYKKAVLSYQELLTRYPKSKNIPEALYKVGESLQAMGFPGDARVFFEEIVKKHSKSSFAKLAQKKLDSLKPKKK